MKLHRMQQEQAKTGSCQVHRCLNLGQPDCDLSLNDFNLVNENDQLSPKRVCTR